MTLNRRCPSPASSARKYPALSGPRWLSEAVILSSRPSSTAPKYPQMPHISPPHGAAQSHASGEPFWINLARRVEFHNFRLVEFVINEIARGSHMDRSERFAPAQALDATATLPVWPAKLIADADARVVKCDDPLEMNPLLALIVNQ